MDSGDRIVTGLPVPGWSVLSINTKVPVELKYLINYYKTVKRIPSFALAVRQLLETHPGLAEIAAELYTKARSPDGPVGSNTPQEKESVK